MDAKANPALCSSIGHVISLHPQLGYSNASDAELLLDQPARVLWLQTSTYGTVFTGTVATLLGAENQESGVSAPRTNYSKYLEHNIVSGRCRAMIASSAQSETC